jgi:hypothetical protein
MKKARLVPVIGTLLAFSFLMIACQMETPEESTAARYAKEYWGEWIRMDASETWYISAGAIKINNSSSSKTVSLSKQSDRVIEVTDGTRKY